MGSPLATIEKAPKFVNCGQFFSIHAGFYHEWKRGLCQTHFMLETRTLV